MAVQASSGHKHALDEVLLDPTVSARVADTKAMIEMRALQEFYTVLGSEPDRAFYGIRHVEAANELQAVRTLLVSDSLFRAADVPTRKRYVGLVETATESGAEVRIFSHLHTSGQRLAMLSGVAAILRFPLPEIDDDGGSDHSDSSADG